MGHPSLLFEGMQLFSHLAPPSLPSAEVGSLQIACAAHEARRRQSTAVTSCAQSAHWKACAAALVQRSSCCRSSRDASMTATHRCRVVFIHGSSLGCYTRSPQDPLPPYLFLGRSNSPRTPKSLNEGTHKKGDQGPLCKCKKLKPV